MKQIESDIKNQQYHSVYLLYGEEEYLVNNYKNYLKEAILAGEDEMNFTRYTDSSIDFDNFRDTGMTLPFFSDYRLIILENTKLFKKASDMTDILMGFPETTIVIFVEKEVDKRNKLYKYVLKNGVVSEMKFMELEETRKYVARQLYKAGKKIRENTVDYLLQNVDNSLTNLENELDKLISYSYGRDEVTREDIDNVCCIQVTGQIFAMLDAVVERRCSDVMKYYHDLLELKESPSSILRLLARHFNILLQLKMTKQNLSKNDLARKVGINHYFINKYQKQCNAFSADKLEEMFSNCVETEYRFKNGIIDEQVGVELLLVEISTKIN